MKLHQNIFPLLIFASSFEIFVYCNSTGQYDCYDSKQQEFNKYLLKEHNKYRKLHEARPLTLDQDLINDAVKYSRHLVDLRELEHSKNRKNTGENLYVSGGTGHPFNPRIMNAAKVWYSEVKGYRGGSESGHFTQLVWKSSKRLGCGICSSRDYKWHVVGCRYSPAGNLQGAYEKNVTPGKWGFSLDTKDVIKIIAFGLLVFVSVLLIVVTYLLFF